MVEVSRALAKARKDFEKLEVTHIELQDRNKENNDLLDQALKDYHDCAEEKEKGKTSDNGRNVEKVKSTFGQIFLKF